jgi:hypothetical protein
MPEHISKLIEVLLVLFLLLASVAMVAFLLRKPLCANTASKQSPQVDPIPTPRKLYVVQCQNRKSGQKLLAQIRPYQDNNRLFWSRKVASHIEPPFRIPAILSNAEVEASVLVYELTSTLDTRYGAAGIRDPDFPCDEFEDGTFGEGNGNCDSDGHYLCNHCTKRKRHEPEPASPVAVASNPNPEPTARS